MILVRAPLRISFVGGGSDLPAFYRQGTPGQVVSCTIAESVYVTVQPSHDGRTRLHYRHVEDVATPADLAHDRARACLRDAPGLEVHSIADVPAGSGLGSSSAFTVALLTALGALAGRRLDAAGVAERACQVEIGDCGHPIGKQDQYASALGGLRAYTFHPDGVVTYRRLAVPVGIDDRLWLLPVGGAHDASHILRQQGASSRAQTGTAALVRLAYDFQAALAASDLDTCGALLGRAWQVKRTLAPGVTTPAIDAAARAAYDAGALGVKLLGAGGAGYLLCWMPAGATLPGARPVRLHHDGARVVYQCG